MGGDFSSQLNPAISVGASLKAGADASYGLTHAAAQKTPAQDLVKDFFKGLRLPAMLTAPPAPGEVILFEFGGRLSVGAKLNLGYQLAGSGSHTLGGLELSERYRLSVLGSLGFESEIAGRFEVEARAGSAAGWARVQVRKSRQRSLGIAADVAINGEIHVEGLPDSPHQFLESVFGLKAKNWLNLFEQAQQLTDFEQLDQFLDGLARQYIEEFTGEAFEKLQENETFQKAMAKIKEVAEDYQNLENSAVELFDRYFDPVAGKIEPEIEAALEKLADLDQLDELQGKVLDGKLGEVLFLLTDGDPLGWLSDEVEVAGELLDTLKTLRERAGQALSLVRDEAHSRIREAITLAKSKFPLDGFIQKAADLDLAALKARADERLIGFAERLIGKSIEGLSNSELGDVVEKVHEALNSVESFTEKFYAKAKEALNSSFQVGLHAGYNRSTTSDALIDVEINLNEAEGRKLMRAAGLGRFAKVLAGAQPSLVRILSGVLTREISRRSSLSVNVVGWHKAWHFQGMRELIVQSEQRIQSEDNGLLTVTTNLTMDNSHERKRNGQRVFTNLVLGFVGHSQGAVEFDEKTARYLIDTITGMSARYNLVLEDPDTTPDELAQYLSFADDFGLATSDLEALETFEPLLPKDAAGHYGETSLSYDVGFTEKGLKSLLTAGLPEVTLRFKARKLVLASYLRKEGSRWADLGWCYWTPGVYNLWKEGQAQFVAPTAKELSPINPSPFKNLESPKKVLLGGTQKHRLSKLFYIEDDLVAAFRQLSATLQDGQRLSPRAYEKALNKFGQALNKYDKIDESDNTFFALIDAWIAASPGQKAVRNSSLTLKSKVGGQEVTKMLMA